LHGFERTKLARSDLAAIWRYSVEQWGDAQAVRYQRALYETCLALSHGQIIGRLVYSGHRHLRVVRCQHHYIFYIAGKTPLIIAVLHEKMDWAMRLPHRLKK
jgi:toxin ParE1/3/4